MFIPWQTTSNVDSVELKVNVISNHHKTSSIKEEKSITSEMTPELESKGRNSPSHKAVHSYPPWSVLLFPADIILLFFCFSFAGFSRLRMHNKGGSPVAFVEYQVCFRFWLHPSVIPVSTSPKFCMLRLHVCLEKRPWPVVVNPSVLILIFQKEIPCN